MGSTNGCISKCQHNWICNEQAKQQTDLPLYMALSPLILDWCEWCHGLGATAKWNPNLPSVCLDFQAICVLKVNILLKASDSSGQWSGDEAKWGLFTLPLLLFVREAAGSDELGVQWILLVSFPIFCVASLLSALPGKEDQLSGCG